MSFKPPVRTLLTALLLGVSLATAAMLSGAAMAQTPAAPAVPAAETKPAAAVPAAPPAVAPATETVENPYGFEALWKQGDFVSKGTLIILIIMSMGTWYIGTLKLLEQAKLTKQAQAADAKFWQAKTVHEGIEGMDEDSAFRFIAEKGLHASEHHSGDVKIQLDRSTWIGMSIQRATDVVANRLHTGLAFLATVGSTAPFVGLFGTVWGIYHALTAIGIAGQASIDKVAGPVGESLIMTAMGLAVAVPAVLGYNWLVRRNKASMELVRHFSGGVHMILLGGGHHQHRT